MSCSVWSRKAIHQRNRYTERAQETHYRQEENIYGSLGVMIWLNICIINGKLKSWANSFFPSQSLCLSVKHARAKIHTKGKTQGDNRLGSRGKRLVFRMLPRPMYSITTRSSPSEHTETKTANEWATILPFKRTQVHAITNATASMRRRPILECIQVAFNCGQV